MKFALLLIFLLTIAIFFSSLTILSLYDSHLDWIEIEKRIDEKRLHYLMETPCIDLKNEIDSYDKYILRTPDNILLHVYEIKC